MASHRRSRLGSTHRQGRAASGLPAAVDGTLRVFAAQKIKADREQAEMTAWRNVRDWVLAQIALIESCDVPMQQIFLPYMADDRGRTVYELYAAGQLAIGDGVKR